MSASGIWLNTQECRSCLCREGRGGAGSWGAGVGVDGVGEAEPSDGAGVAFWVAGSAIDVALERVERAIIVLKNGKGFWRFACFGGMLFAYVMVDAWEAWAVVMKSGDRVA